MQRSSLSMGRYFIQGACLLCRRHHHLWQAWIRFVLFPYLQASPVTANEALPPSSSSMTRQESRFMSLLPGVEPTSYRIIFDHEPSVDQIPYTPSICFEMMMFRKSPEQRQTRPSAGTVVAIYGTAQCRYL